MDEQLNNQLVFLLDFTLFWLCFVTIAFVWDYLSLWQFVNRSCILPSVVCRCWAFFGGKMLKCLFCCLFLNVSFKERVFSSEMLDPVWPLNSEGAQLCSSWGGHRQPLVGLCQAKGGCRRNTKTIVTAGRRTGGQLLDRSRWSQYIHDSRWYQYDRPYSIQYTCLCYRPGNRPFFFLFFEVWLTVKDIDACLVIITCGVHLGPWLTESIISLNSTGSGLPHSDNVHAWHNVIQEFTKDQLNFSTWLNVSIQWSHLPSWNSSLTMFCLRARFWRMSFLPVFLFFSEALSLPNLRAFCALTWKWEWPTAMKFGPKCIILYMFFLYIYIYIHISMNIYASEEKHNGLNRETPLKHGDFWYVCQIIGVAVFVCAFTFAV